MILFKPSTLFSKHNIAFFLIIGFAFFIRAYRLTFQSLWLDELYTMYVAHPDNSFQEILIELKNSDFHPPLHYLLTHFLFQVIEYNDFIGRLTSVIFGTLGVIAMYFLGLQIKDKRTGLLMMLLASVNYYQLYYSQEIRMYILLFLFTALSALFFLRIVTKSKPIDYLLYTLITSLLLYTHYFGFFIFGAEVLCFLHLIFRKLEPDKIKKGLVAGVGVVVLYLPWLPIVLQSGAKEHWMVTPNAWYLIEYLYRSLGKDPISFILYVAGLILFIRLFLSNDRNDCNQKNASFLLILYGLFSIYILTFFVSLVKPVLQARCTITAIPILIAAVVLGLDSLKNKFTRISVSVILISAIINLVFVRKYYSKITKENFKAISSVTNKYYPNTVALSYYAKYYNYYFEQLDAKINVVNPLGRKPASLLSKTNEFVLLNAHLGTELMSAKKIRYPLLENYIATHFYIDTIFRAKDSYEHAILYKRRR